MLRRVILISIVTACGSCMEMRETVERVVMVRTTGSDLQPAATGYIYKKKNDGHESVIEMGESEVMDHLSKFYEQPKDYGAHVSSGNYVKDGESSKVATNSEERVIPVKENQEEPVDGIADIDYKKIYDDYTAKYTADDNAYDEYLKSLKDLKGSLYSKYDADSAEYDKEYKNNYQYGKGNTGNYQNTKLHDFSDPESYKTDRDENSAKNDHNEGYHHVSKENEHNTAHDQNDDAPRFHRVYDNSDKTNDHDHFRKGVKGFTHDHKYYGANNKGYGNNGFYESKNHNANLKQSGNQDKASEQEQGANHNAEKLQGTSQGTHGDIRSQHGKIDNKSYGYKIKH